MKEKHMGKSRSLLWKSTLLLALLCIVFLHSGTQSEAAGMRKLSVGKSYTTKLTGAKKHTIKFTYQKGEYDWDYLEALNIFVDGKKVKKWKGGTEYYWNIYLCQVSAGRTLLYLEGISDNDYTTSIRVMEYKNKKLKQLADLTELSRNGWQEETQKLFSGWARGYLKKVGTNQLTLRWSETGNATGIVCVNVTYKISGSRIIQTGSSYALKFTDEYLAKEWTAKRSFSAYTAAGGSKVSFRVQPGDRVKPLRLTRKDGKLYFQIKNTAGQKGWFRDIDSYGDTYFEEAFFAG